MLRSLNRKDALGVLALIASSLLTLPAIAQVQLTHPGASALFGFAVDLSGARAVVGDPEDGVVYVFEKVGGAWTETAALSSEPPEPMLFGESVAISGNTVVVGHSPGDSVVFTAYVYEKVDGNWTETAHLFPSGAKVTSGGGFGADVAIDGNTILVGDDSAHILAGPGVPSAGSAHVFTRQGSDWVESAVLTADPPVSFAHFGTAVAVSGDTALIHAPDEFEFGSPPVYVFERQPGGDWLQTQTLDVAGLASDEYFGQGISLTADSALIRTESQKIFAFERQGGTWELVQDLTPQDCPVSSSFDGEQILNHEGNLAVIVTGGPGPAGKHVAQLQSDRSQWSIQGAIATASSPVFGGARSVSVSQGTILVGADTGTDTAAAYIVEPTLPSPWQDLGYGLGGSGDCTPFLIGAGQLAGSDEITLVLSNVSGSSTGGFLLAGFEGIFAPFLGGTLVPALPPSGTIVGPLSFAGGNVISATWPPGLPPGFAMYFQYWIVDPGGPFGASASNAVLATQP